MDYYQILQISKTASQEEIKKAYRKLSRKYHPDNAGEQGRNLFDQVQEAYAVLGDEEKRTAYDRKLDGISQERQQRQEGNKKGSTNKNSENNYKDLAAFYSGNYKNSFEKFFGFQPDANSKDQAKGAGPVNTDKLFESFFKVK